MNNDRNLTFYSPNGVSWEIKNQEVQLDKQRLVTIPVRRYFHDLAEYTFLACVDYDYPGRIFYDLGIKPSDTQCPASFATNIRVLKNMMEESPIPMAKYVEAERKLQRKVEQRKMQIEENLKQNILDEKKHDQESVGDIKCTMTDRVIVHIAYDDDDFSGGVLAVYSRSGIHANG